MSSDKTMGMDPMNRFHGYLAKPEITHSDLADLLLIAQEIR